ncbi:hypothetical protein H0O00_05580 [Candidatus Micrarchaeota archaeon]|nr:hypothetical protein [Candidatus Micrarchaeota archaeon]
MAEPVKKIGTEALEASRIKGMAVQAAQAYRAYIVDANEARWADFWKIYNANARDPQDGKEKALNQNQLFMGTLRNEWDKLKSDSKVAPLLEAYNDDIGIMVPEVKVDFITRVHNIRSELNAIAVSDSEVAAFVKNMDKAKAVKADTAIGRVRADVRAGMSNEDAARQELMKEQERKAVPDIAERYGKKLTAELASRRPEQQARMAITALHEFMLTGDPGDKTTFRAIFDANPSAAFLQEFEKQFLERIYPDPKLTAIIKAYAAKREGEMKPARFTDMVATVYQSAASGNVESVERLRKDEGTDVVDPLLKLVAHGMAARAMEFMRQVGENGDLIALNAFNAILNGQLAEVVDGVVQMPLVQHNEEFWGAFTALYAQEMKTGRLYSQIYKVFERSILSIAVRDIYAELAMGSPDMERLRVEYGTRLVQLVSSNIADLAWLVRDPREIDDEMENRARMNDAGAKALKAAALKLPAGVSAGSAVAEAYAAVSQERIAQHTIDPDLLDTIGKNLEQLSWLDNTPQQIQAEIRRRGRTDPLAVALASKYDLRSRDVCESVSKAYQKVKAVRQAVGQAESKYGKDLVKAVKDNLDSMQWLLRPMVQIGQQMNANMGSRFMDQLNTSAGYSETTLAYALKDIYGETGKAAPDRARLERSYGKTLVSYVEGNRAALGWLSGSVASIEKDLREKKDDYTQKLLANTYPIIPSQFLRAIAVTRRAVGERGGLAQQDVRDAYGDAFNKPIADSESTKRPGMKAGLAEQLRNEIVSRHGSIDSFISGVERQLSDRVMEPVRPMMSEWIREWRRESDTILTEAESTMDSAQLNRLVERQRVLIDPASGSIIRPEQLRLAVRIAFSMIHLAETGKDLQNAPMLESSLMREQLAKLRRDLNDLVGDYTTLSTKNPEKGRVLGDVIAAVTRHANPGLFQFIIGVDEPAYFKALGGAYNSLVSGTGWQDRATLMEMYGPQFVTELEAQAKHLKLLEKGAGIDDLALGENELFAAIVKRCYLAIVSPTETENRNAMVKLFGERFVKVVEDQKGKLGAMNSPTAGLAELQSVDEIARARIFQAYPAAYSQSVKSLMRAYRKQNEELFRSLTSIYRLIKSKPAKAAEQGVKEMYELYFFQQKRMYGERLVDYVKDNLSKFAFLERLDASPKDLASLDPAVLEALQSAFESGPMVGRTNFMKNLLHVQEMIPRVYGMVGEALSLYSPPERVGADFARAVNFYREQFGSNDFLFNQYLNLQLLGQKIMEISSGAIMLPEAKARAIKENRFTADMLAGFLQSPSGQAFISRCQGGYTELEKRYRQDRQDRNFHPETADDLSDEKLDALKARLSVIDAFYIGLAINEIGGPTAFGSKAVDALMDTILTLSDRDTYLIGPFLLQALPAMVQGAQTEEILIAGLQQFRTTVSRLYQQEAAMTSYSIAHRRRYFLEVFASIESDFLKRVSTFDHHNLEDEERRMAERTALNWGQENPLFHSTKGIYWGQELDQIPGLYEQPLRPEVPVPHGIAPVGAQLRLGGFLVDSDATRQFARMKYQLLPETALMLNLGVPVEFKIGGMGMSSYLRMLSHMFPPIPTEYSDYLLSGYGHAAGYYGYEGAETSTTKKGGTGAMGGLQTPTGGGTGEAKWEMLDTKIGTGREGESTSGQVTQGVDVTAAAGGVPYPMVGPIITYLPSSQGWKEQEKKKLEEEKRKAPQLQEEAKAFYEEHGGFSALLDSTVAEVRKDTKEDGKLAQQAMDSVYANDEAKMADSLRQLIYTEIASVTDTAAYAANTGMQIAKDEDGKIIGVTIVDAKKAGKAMRESVVNSLKPEGLPPEEQGGLHSGTLQMTGAWAETTVPQVGETGALVEKSYESQSSFKGMMETCSRLAKTKGIDMLFFFSGTYIPELPGLPPQVPPAAGTKAKPIQEGEGRVKTRLILFKPDGSWEQVAYGYDTRAKLLNYTYGGGDEDYWLASAKMIGRKQFTSKEAEGGFSGMAVGFTIPTGEGDNFSALGVGQLTRNMSTMDPVFQEEAIGSAFTRIRDDQSQRDVHVLLFNGVQTADMRYYDAQGRKLEAMPRAGEYEAKMKGTTFAEANVQYIRQTLALKPLENTWEFRAGWGYVGEGTKTLKGWPQSVAGRFRKEAPITAYRTDAYGITVARTEVDLLRQARVAMEDADKMYSSMKDFLMRFYQWSENRAEETGHLIAASYLYSQLEDYTVKDAAGNYITDKKNAPSRPDPNYASLLFMYWAQRHNILVGGSRAPNFDSMYNRINDAMADIQANPTEEASILKALSENLNASLAKSVWKVSLGYGYNGEANSFYTIASGRYSAADKANYGGLYSVYIFGKPTIGFVDLAAHAYMFPTALVAREKADANGATTGTDYTHPIVRKDTFYTDIDIGGGLRWPLHGLVRYEQEAVLTQGLGKLDAVRRCYREMGGIGYDSLVLRDVYGKDLVKAVEEARDTFGWMVRPESEIKREFAKRLDEGNPSVTRIKNILEERTTKDPAVALRDVFLEIKKSEPDMQRLLLAYPAEMIEAVREMTTDLDWMLLPDNEMVAQFTAEAAKEKSVARHIVEEVAMPLGIGKKSELTGAEVRLLMERNLLDVLVAVKDADTREGHQPERYDVYLGTHLATEGKNDTHKRYYVLHTPITVRAGGGAEGAPARGALKVGDEEDLQEWLRPPNNHMIGMDVFTLDIDATESGDYKFTFSGDRRGLWLTAQRAFGSLTLPLETSAYKYHDFSHNWSAGYLASIFQDYKQELLGGIFYGTKQYGDLRWNEYKVVLSHNINLINTSTMNQAITHYIFLKGDKIFVASSGVFEDKDELKQACMTLGCDISEISRTTVGYGITVAKADFVAGDKLSVHFYVEGGTETGWRPTPPASETTTAVAPTGKKTSTLVGETAVGVEWTPDYGGGLGPSYYIKAYFRRGRAITGAGLDQSNAQDVSRVEPYIGKEGKVPVEVGVSVGGQF